MNLNTLLIGIGIILLFVAGRDVLNALGKTFGLFDVPEGETVVIYKDRFLAAPTVEPTKKEIDELAEAVTKAGLDPVSILSMHIIPVPKPAPGRDVTQRGSIIRPIDKPIQNEDGSYNLDLFIKYDSKVIFGFRFNPMIAVGFDGKDFSPGLGSTFFQIHRLEASAHATTKYAALGGSYLLRKETGLGVAYGFVFGKTAPQVVAFAKVGF